MMSRCGFWLRPLLWVGLACCLTTACFIPYAPEMRGWRCVKNADCVGELKCWGEQCRASCLNDLDCQRALGEKCIASKNSTIKFCCQEGKKESCNNKDDDCDGVIDNDAPCASGTCQNGKCQE